MEKTLVSLPAETEAIWKTLQGKVGRKLVGFSNDFPKDADVWGMRSTRLSSSDFPVPELVLLVLRNIMGCRWSGLGEKVRWSVYATFLNEPIAFELGKFGFDLRWRAGAEIDHERITGQLQTALRALEIELSSYAEAQVNAGRVTLANHAGEFGARYQFFRQLAKKAYLKAKRVFAKAGEKGPSAPSIASVLNRNITAEREGFFHSAAMVDAYFSYLEHRLILLRAFTGKPLAHGEFKTLLTARWDEKFKMVVSDTGGRTRELLLTRLRGIKERIRNPFADVAAKKDWRISGRFWGPGDFDGRTSVFAGFSAFPPFACGAG